MGAVRRTGAVLLVVGTGLVLAGCEEASGLVPVQTVTVTATSTPSASSSVPTAASASASASTPSSASAVPVSTPRASGGCSPNDVSIDVGMSRTIVDVDGDGRRDTEFYTEEKPLRFGIRTASGATIVVDDDLPGDVHRGWIGITERGPEAVIDDESTAQPYDFQDCRFIRLEDASGSPYSFRLGNPDGVKPTGVACTNQNGGTFLAASRLVERSDGRYDVYWGILQGRGDHRYQADPVSGSDAYRRYSGLAASDERVARAGQSWCGDSPVVYWPDA